jgi:hypothetical protein
MRVNVTKTPPLPPSNYQRSRFMLDSFHTTREKHDHGKHGHPPSETILSLRTENETVTPVQLQKEMKRASN